MEIVYKEHDKYAEYYQSFFEEQKLPFSYHPLSLKYHQLIASPYLDTSFLVVENKKCVGICYCPIYKIQGKNHISNNGGYIIAPSAINERIYKAIFKILEEISAKYKCATMKIYLDSSSILHFFNHEKNFSSKENVGGGGI